MRAQDGSLTVESRCFVPATPERALNTSFNGLRAKNGPKTYTVVNSARHLLALAVTERSVNDCQPVEAS